MSAFAYRISGDIFARYPGYVRGVVIVHDVTNAVSPPELIALLREAEESVRMRTSSERVAEEPAIKAWRDAYRLFGAKPSEFRSSVEAMARRALRGDCLPSINTLVDIGNVISLRYLVPAGSHAIDRLNGDIELRFATGTEEFTALGSTEMEHPLPGEVIFTEGEVVLTRRWTWRQAEHTLTLPETTAVEFNVDGLPPVNPDEIATACAELTELVTRYCGGNARTEYLTATNRELSLGDR